MNQSNLQTVIIASAMILGGNLFSSSALATPFTMGPRIFPGTEILPTPVEVPGKEYSNHIDVDDTQPTPMLDPEQNLAWDGIGGRNNTFDYSNSRLGDSLPREVDAIANAGDALYFEVINDRTWLLFSTDEDNRIFYEEHVTGANGIWALPPTIDADMAAIDPNIGIQNTMPTDMDVDGLEVWGGDGPQFDDANRYSLEDDPFNNIAVWKYDKNINLSTPLYTKTDIAQAIDDLFPNFDIIAEDIDLDAMMTFGSNIMFSVDPIIDKGLDGGEIFVWDGVAASAIFLTHGGHIWDTTFDVMGTFGTATENINALEAVGTFEDSPICTGGNCSQTVPEPGTILGLLAISGLGLGLKRKKQS